MKTVVRILRLVVALALTIGNSQSSATYPNCDQYDYELCDYSWDPGSQCCLAPPPSPGLVCPDACY